jgi:ElaB/YqjD/DUF883 family membrane-anchored ribosome-binding protein
MNVQEKCEIILTKHKIPSCHSNFQIRNFIIGKESSPIAKLWQCIRELQARQETIDALENDYKDLLDNIEIAKLDLQELEESVEEVITEKLGILHNKKKTIQIRKQNRNIERLHKSKNNLDNQRNNILKEMRVLIEEFDNLTAECPYKDFDDESAQLEYWTEKFQKEIVLTQTLGLPPNPELLKSCLALPENSELRKNIEIALLQANKKLIKENN